MPPMTRIAIMSSSSPFIKLVICSSSGFCCFMHDNCKKIKIIIVSFFIDGKSLLSVPVSLSKPHVQTLRAQREARWCWGMSSRKVGCERGIGLWIDPWIAGIWGDTAEGLRWQILGASVSTWALFVLCWLIFHVFIKADNYKLFQAKYHIYALEKTSFFSFWWKLLFCVMFFVDNI